MLIFKQSKWYRIQRYVLKQHPHWPSCVMELLILYPKYSNVGHYRWTILKSFMLFYVIRLEQTSQAFKSYWGFVLFCMCVFLFFVFCFLHHQIYMCGFMFCFLLSQIQSSTLSFKASHCFPLQWNYLLNWYKINNGKERIWNE